MAVATHPGREHLRLHRNNQDAVAVAASGEALVLVVADGCSAGRRSEVGAQLGAELIARHWLAHPEPAGIGPALDEFLGSLLGRLGGGPALVADLLLFSFLAARISSERTTVLGLGDGLLQLGDERRCLSAGPHNAPPYAAYRLLDPALLERPVETELVLHFDRASPLQSPLILGTDGVLEIQGELDGWLADPALHKNPHHLGRRLRQAAAQRHGLLDDTSLAILLPRPEGA